VPDPRLKRAGRGSASRSRIVPTSLEFVDKSAGLVRGASKGEGLGQSVPRQYSARVDAIIHVAAVCFEDSDITHVEGSIDPLRDIEVVETEVDAVGTWKAWERRLVQAQKARQGRPTREKCFPPSQSWSRWRPRCRKGRPGRATRKSRRARRRR